MFHIFGNILFKHCKNNVLQICIQYENISLISCHHSGEADIRRDRMFSIN